MDGLDDAQAATVSALLSEPRAVRVVVGPAGAGKTRKLATAVDAWRNAGAHVFGAAPSAAAAQQLHDGAGLDTDTLHKLVHEHTTKQTDGRGPTNAHWDLPAHAVVIVDEAGMVDTQLLHAYTQIAKQKQWRTVLVGDHRQLDAVDAGGMFAELANDPNVATNELDTLHRFEQAWEAEATLHLRDRDPTAVDIYAEHGRIHGHPDQTAAIQAVADEAFARIVEGRDVLVMAPTSAMVDELNRSLTNRLLEAGWLDPANRIEIGGHEFYPGQPVVTRANDRRLTYGHSGREWVRNGDRWTVHTGTRDELYLTNSDTGDRHALRADYIAAGNVTVDYASTINRAQGATVDEAHVIIDERTNAKQLYVGATRGRAANHIHSAPPGFEPDHRGPARPTDGFSGTNAVCAALERQPNRASAIARRRELRDLTEHFSRRGRDGDGLTELRPSNPESERAATAMRRLQHLARRRTTHELGR